MNFDKPLEHELPINPAFWETSITDYFINTWPKLSKLYDKIKLVAKKPEKGAAVGYITLKNGYKIPVIVENNILKPLDIIIDDSGKYTYLTSRKVEAIANLQDSDKIYTKVNPAKAKQMLSLDKTASEWKVNVYKSYFDLFNEPKALKNGDPMPLNKIAEELTSKEMEELLSSGEVIKVSGLMHKYAGLVYTRKHDNSITNAVAYEIVDLDTGKKTNMWILVYPDARFKLVNNIDKNYIADDNAHPTPTFKHVVSEGDTILFLGDDGHSGYGPFKIKEMFTDDDGVENFILETVYNIPQRNIVIKRDRKILKFSKIDEETYLMPKMWSISVLQPEENPFMKEQEIETTKEASILEDKNMVAVHVVKKDGKYLLTSPNLPKELNGSYDIIKATKLLKKLGVSTFDITNLSKMKNGDEFSFMFKKQVISKVASDSPAFIEAEKLAKEIKKELEKTAEFKMVKSTVDKILGLNEVTPERIKQMRLVAGEIKVLIDDLSQILLAKRLEPKNVPLEEESLINVLDKLSELEAILKSI